MEDFQGMSRATTRSKTTTNYWQFARNIILGRSRRSISNEEGFDLKHEIPGKYIGEIETNEEVIYFSVDENFSYIGYYKTNQEPAEYIPVLKSIYLGFKENRPIEGVFYYNYHKELIIAFSDGIFKDSNTPKLINITKIGIELTPDNELVNPDDLAQLQFFSQSLEGDINFDYTETGTLEVDIAYVTYSYVLADGESTTIFFPIRTVTHPTYNFKEEDRRNLILNFTNLDTRYKKIRIGLLTITDSGLKGYQSEIITYSGNSYTTTLSNINGYTEISAEILTVGKDVYSRIRTMTFQNDELDIGNVVKDDTIQFQKYANQLNLGLHYDIRKGSKHTSPTLCPDEAYAIYIHLQLLNGNYTEGFYIPGPTANPVNNETDVLSNADLNALGLGNLIGTDTYKKFRILNSGNFKTSGTDIDNPLDLELNWGYWENEELFPNDSEYDSTIDYNGSPLGGEDLRNTPIRGHRVPGLDALTSKFPSLVGYTNKNSDFLLGKGEDTDDAPSLLYGAVPSLAINVLNFDTVVPQEIKDKIQGFRLTIAKRKTGECLVEDINFLKQAKDTLIFYQDGLTDFNVPRYQHFDPNDSSGGRPRYRGMQFGSSRVKSNQLHIYKPAITGKLVKANYAAHDSNNNTTTAEAGIVERDMKDANSVGNVGGIRNSAGTGLFSYLKIKPDQKYATIKEVKYVPGNIELPSHTLFIEENVMLYANNTLQLPVSVGGFPDLDTNWNPLLITDLAGGTGAGGNADVLGYNPATKTYVPYSFTSDLQTYTFSICSTFINLVKNINNGFDPTDFITLGKVRKESSTDLIKDCGDIFTNTLYNVPQATKPTGNSTQINQSIQYNQLILKGGYDVTNNSEVYILKDRKYGRYYDLSNDGSDLDELATFIYTLQIFNKEVYRSLNDIISDLAFNINKNFTDYFPYRVHRSLKVSNESLSTNNIRSFLSNRYKEMLNDRGEIVALRGTAKTLFIQQKFTLSVAKIKDKLETGVSETYLGTGDIFDREPDEVMEASNKGYIGCTSQFACLVFKYGYITVDQVKGKLWIVGQNGKEISAKEMDIWFSENWDTSNPYYTLDRFGNKQPVDNPYTQIGHCVGIDEKYRRILFTKKMYKFKYEELVGIDYTFDGEYYYYSIGEVNVKLNYTDTDYFEETSITFSYHMEYEEFICEHDYFPNGYVYTNKGLFSVNIPNNSEVSKVYKHNSKLNKCTFYGEKFESYVDLIFNSRYDLSKLYQAMEWVTEVIAEDESRNYFKTIDKIMLYTDYQCTGIINIPDNTFSISRNKENVWNFNNFRDMVVDANLPIIDDRGRINQNNINFNKSWFAKSNFINTFIVTRLIMSNQTNDTIYIHCVNVKSRVSDK